MTSKLSRSQIQCLIQLLRIAIVAGVVCYLVAVASQSSSAQDFAWNFQNQRAGESPTQPPPQVRSPSDLPQDSRWPDAQSPRDPNHRPNGLLDRLNGVDSVGHGMFRREPPAGAPDSLPRFGYPSAPQPEMPDYAHDPYFVAGAGEFPATGYCTGGGCCAGCGLIYKPVIGVNCTTWHVAGGEPRWKHSHPVPWEAFAHGEYIGPHRTPHVPEYRVRVNDRLEFVYRLTRQLWPEPYRLHVGDEIEVTSAGGDAELNQPQLRILSDGTISLRMIGRVHAAGKTLEQLQDELNEAYSRFVRVPAIVVRGIKTETALEDLRDAVDARFGAGGQGREVIVSPDGTIQLPMVGSVPAVGLTLDELAREVNLRYASRIHGIEVTPILIQRAPRYIYVLGEVNVGGQIELTGPTTAIQAIAMAGGWRPGANARQIVVLRRDENWQLVATKLDLGGALAGRRPYPSDEIWLRDSDIVLVPKTPIQRTTEIIDLYFTRGLYALFPGQGLTFTFDNSTRILSP